MPTTDFLPAIGGVAQHIYELARAHAAAGHEVEVVAAIWSDEWQKLWFPPYTKEIAGFRTYYIPLALNTDIKFLSGRTSGKLSDLRFRRLLLSRLKHERPDLVHWHAINSRSNPMASWHDSPKVWTNHTSQFIDAMGDAVGRKLCAAEAHAADRIMAPSQELCDLTISLGYDAERVTFISNGVDAARFRPDVDPGDWIQRIGLKAGEKLILCPRRLEKKNGVRFFIEAALEVLKSGRNDLVFAVAGNFTGPRSDSDEDIVDKMIAASGKPDRFRMLGRVENAEIPGLYAAAFLVVMPSLIEATSLSAMEAMATGKALVSTNVGGLPFLIRDEENGLLVPPSDAHALASGINKLLDDPASAARLGANGRKRVEAELDWKSIARQTREVYMLAETDFKKRRPA